MNEFTKKQYVNYRLAKANEVLVDAKTMIENQRWTSSVNRLYYAAFYALSALLHHNGYTAKSHTGAKYLFSLHFVKTKLFSIDHGVLYSKLEAYRNNGDYDDMFDFDKETVEPLLEPTINFKKRIETIINQ
jgi:uncharacterized protein (UPF0332 family)